MADLTIQQQIDKAQAAYYAIISGTNVIKFIDQNGEQVQYGNGNVQKLADFIEELKSQLPGSCFRHRQAIGYFF